MPQDELEECHEVSKLRRRCSSYASKASLGAVKHHVDVHGEAVEALPVGRLRRLARASRGITTLKM